MMGIEEQSPLQQAQTILDKMKDRDTHGVTYESVDKVVADLRAAADLIEDYFENWQDIEADT